MSLETLISEYGYYAVAAGTFLEGETILVLGGFAAHRGYLELPWVITSAFVGALSGDQLYYYIGRTRGRRMLDTRPKWKAKSEKVLALLQKHQVLLILGFRFLYGIRTVTPFLIGASKISPVRFLVLNIIGAAIWAIVIGSLGYLFGHTLDLFIGDAKKYELSALVLIVVAGAIFRLIQARKNASS